MQMLDNWKVWWVGCYTVIVKDLFNGIVQVFFKAEKSLKELLV